MQIQSTTSSAVLAQAQQAQGKRHLTATSSGAKEKFDTRMRGSMGAPTAGPGNTGAPTRSTRSIPAAFQNMPGPTILPGGTPPASTNSFSASLSVSVDAAAAPAGGPASAASNSGAFSKLNSDSANSIWYGGPDGGASVSGTYSEKASYGGMTGIGHPNYGTTANGGDMVISVNGLHGKNPAPTQVMALDSNAVMQANGGVWPGTPAEMQRVLKANPQCILADVQASPPQMARISGIPAGTKVTIMTGAEGIMGNPPRTPPGSQAMVTNIDQLSAKHQAMVPPDSIMAGGMEQMMKAAAESAAKAAAAAALERSAQEASQRFATQSAANMAGAAAAERMGAGQAGALASAGGRPLRGNPPVALGGSNRGAPTSVSMNVSVSSGETAGAQQPMSLNAQMEAMMAASTGATGS